MNQLGRALQQGLVEGVASVAFALVGVGNYLAQVHSIVGVIVHNNGSSGPNQGSSFVNPIEKPFLEKLFLNNCRARHWHSE